MKRPKVAAFTILELLVAAGISMMLVVVLLSTMQGMTSHYTRTQGAITRNGDASIALDQIVQDIEGMVIPNFARGEGLRLASDPDLPGNPTAMWLTLLTTTTDKDNSFSGANAPDFTGSKRAVSYRLAFQNPLNPEKTTDQSYALYRSIASARHTFENVTGGVTNLQTQYWNSPPSTPAPAPFPPTDERAFFTENIVGLSVRFEYLNSNGEAVWTSPGDDIRIGRDGSTINGSLIPSRFRRAEVTVTTLSPEGAQRLRDGVFSLDEAIRRYGKVSIRETARF